MTFRKASVGIALGLAMLEIGGAYASDKVTVPLFDGMTIKTADAVANVEVRAKSLGPGFCAVTFSADPSGQRVGMNAPPLLWSNWVTLTSHIGAVAITISQQVECDVGVVAEVRYFR